MILLVAFTRLVEYLHRIAPPYLSHDWDNSGLQISPTGDEIKRVFLTLDHSYEALNRGIEVEADLIISHHPLLFDPLEQVDRSSTKGQKLKLLLCNDMGLLALHTNFDRARRGLSHRLAEELGLKNSITLLPASEAKYRKVVIFLPSDSEREVLGRAFELVDNRLEHYADCSFRCAGTSTFRPLEGANPHAGQIGELKEVKELRLELLVPREQVGELLEGVREVHPYEEMAYDVYRTEKADRRAGLGRFGCWEQERTLIEAADYCASTLQGPLEHLRVTGDRDSPVQKVAVCPGAGGVCLEPALKAGCDLLIVGEVDHHHRIEGHDQGLSLIEAGHYHTEKLFKVQLRDLLREEFSPRDLSVELMEENSP
ncbi:MAG: Nif3-like dinuclear metal center hexameric protein [Candidatus Acetothermia bacterium]